MEDIKHWAESLQSGDRVTATIRHPTDGKLNRHNVDIIVIAVGFLSKSILGYDGLEEIEIPFNELSKPLPALPKED